MGTQLIPFSGARSALLAVTGANTTIAIPPGFNTLVVSMLGVTDNIVFDEGTEAAFPAAGTFTPGTVVQGGTVQSFAITQEGGTYVFTPSAAGGTIGLTVGFGA